MKKCLILLTMIFSSAYALEYKSKVEVKTNKLKDIVSNFNFNYFTKYTGASLGGSYSRGATFNRFDGGIQNGKDFDTTGSYQLYQSFRLGYRFKNNWNLAYGVTFQENLTSDVEFEWPNGQKGTRPNGKIYNNHRVSLFVPSAVSTKIGYMHANYFYEIPNQVSRGNGMQHGVGFQPTFNFYTNIPDVFIGVNGSFEKYFFEENAFNPQGTRISVGPFINYRINNRFTFKNSFDFDWEQRGDDVDTTTFSENMHDVGLTGLGARIVKNIFVDIFVGYSISEMSLENTSLGASLDISI